MKNKKRIATKGYTYKFIEKISGFYFQIGERVQCIRPHKWTAARFGETYKVLDVSKDWHIKIKTVCGFEFVHQSRFKLVPKGERERNKKLGAKC